MSSRRFRASEGDCAGPRELCKCCALDLLGMRSRALARSPIIGLKPRPRQKTFPLCTPIQCSFRGRCRGHSSRPREGRFCGRWTCGDNSRSSFHQGDRPTTTLGAGNTISAVYRHAWDSWNLIVMLSGYSPLVQIFVLSQRLSKLDLAGITTLCFARVLHRISIDLFYRVPCRLVFFVLLGLIETG